MGWRHTAYHIINSFALKAAIGQSFENNFCQSVQKHWREGEREKKKERHLQSALSNTQTQ